MTIIMIDEWDTEVFDLECPNTDHHDRYGYHWETEYESETDSNGDPCEPYEGCPDCEDDSGYLAPMSNYGHIIDYDGMITDEIRKKIASETPCILVQNNKTGQWLIALTGGGMDLSPRIAYAYVLAQKWLPLDLMESLDREYCRQELGAEKFETLRSIMDQQTANQQNRFANMHEQWKKA